MIKTSLFIFTSILIILLILKLRDIYYYFEKFNTNRINKINKKNTNDEDEESNIEINGPKEDSNIEDLIYSESKLSKKENIETKGISKSNSYLKKNHKVQTNQINQKNIDYKNDTILLSCFKKRNLDTFNKYEKYATKVYYKEDGEVVGEVWITPSHVLENLPQISLNGYFLNNLCVKQEHRRKGIARKLLNKVIKKAKKEEKLHIILNVFSKKNPHLVKFYGDLGFQTYSTGIDHNGEESKLMFLVL